MRSIQVYRSTRINPIPEFLRPLDIIKGNKYATLARTEGNRIREYREVRLAEVDSEEPVPSPEALTGVPVSRFRSKAAIQARKG